METRSNQKEANELRMAKDGFDILTVRKLIEHKKNILKLRVTHLRTLCERMVEQEGRWLINNQILHR